MIHGNRWKHGHSCISPSGNGSREYRIWSHAKARTVNPDDPAFKWYGARGIRMCKRWINSFENFLNDMGLCPGDKTLGRKNNNGDYSPSNCEWQDWYQQQNNRRNNKLWTLSGRTQTQAQWTREFGMDQRMLHQRLKSGMPIEEALTTKIRHWRKIFITLDGVTKTREEWARQYHKHGVTIKYRLEHGWSVREAITT